MTLKTRVESDSLGSMQIPEEARYGIHTARAIANFDIAGRPLHPLLIRAYGMVKLACARTNRALGFFPDTGIADAIENACREMADGSLIDDVIVDALQGGAGTSANMCINEVIANRALEMLRAARGEYAIVSPLNHINKHQSTNDTFPTAIRLAAINSLHDLEKAIIFLQESFQKKEKAFADIVKVGRTQMQDAMLITLGREMGAYAEALSRDRWRIYKCEERLRVINLGGTAIGTGASAPREYIFRVVDMLRELTGIGFARAENLIEATQNNDVFVEVSGMLKTLATNLVKISSDLRFLSSGPHAGLGEIHLPARQAGSSIMPGKVNPVIPESVQQAGMLVMGLDSVIASACASGNLELNPFLPLVAHCLLDELDLLTRACIALQEKCVDGIMVDAVRCSQYVEKSMATAGALLQVMTYEKASEIAALAMRQNESIRNIVISQGLMTSEQYDQLTAADAVCRLGFSKDNGSR
jgi:aspartate ammonia-lyase